MITEAELRRNAARAGVDVMVQELDYALGWFLAGLFSQTDVADYLIFKGGTCLRKCYFKDYRFSEDLDFTLAQNLSVNKLQLALGQVLHWSRDVGGPDFGAAAIRYEIINDEYGTESYQARVYYRGPVRYGGPARVIQVDVSHNEKVVFPVAARTLIHQYSDAERLPRVAIPSYDLAEMLAEKLRAVSGQRRFAVSRDIYDIYQLQRQAVDEDAVVKSLAAKFAAKNMQINAVSPSSLVQQKTMFEADWRRRLAHLLPPEQPITFEQAWFEVVRLLRLLDG